MGQGASSGKEAMYRDEQMFGDDRLFKVPEEHMQRQLHKHIGPLTYRSRQCTFIGKGTATLISPNLILTSAHNLYSKNTGEVYYDFKFYPGQCGPLEKCY
jgi:hypothetical protein